MSLRRKPHNKNAAEHPLQIVGQAHVILHKPKPSVEDSIDELKKYGESLMKDHEFEFYTISIQGSVLNISSNILNHEIGAAICEKAERENRPLLIKRGSNYYIYIQTKDGGWNFRGFPKPASQDLNMIFSGNQKIGKLKTLTNNHPNFVSLVNYIKKNKSKTKDFTLPESNTYKQGREAAELADTLSHCFQEHKDDPEELQRAFTAAIDAVPSLNEQRRGSFNHIVANIAFGVATLGIAPLVSLCVNKRLDFFFTNTTTRKKMVDKTVETLGNVKKNTR